MQTIPDLKKLYEEDEHQWFFENAKLLRAGRLDLADIEHIAETLEDMGKRESREVLSRMRIFMMHLLKWAFQVDRRGNSWELTIKEQRYELNQELSDSKVLKNFALENLNKVYKKAKEFSATETGLPLSTYPLEPPFTFEQVLYEDYFPA
jgi:hypothetical protein